MAPLDSEKIRRLLTKYHLGLCSDTELQCIDLWYENLAYESVAFVDFPDYVLTDELRREMLSNIIRGIYRLEREEANCKALRMARLKERKSLLKILESIRLN